MIKVILTCAALITATSTAFIAWSIRSDRQAVAQKEEQVARIARQTASQIRLIKCNADIEAHDAVVRPRYAPYEDPPEIRLCRSLIKIDELSRSKPSE